MNFYYPGWKNTVICTQKPIPIFCNGPTLIHWSMTYLLGTGFVRSGADPFKADRDMGA